MPKPELTKEQREIAAARERSEWWEEKFYATQFEENKRYYLQRSNHWFNIAENLETKLP